MIDNLLFGFLMMMRFVAASNSKCSWGFRFDEDNNHFNIVYPDKNSVYFGFILPNKTNNFTVASSTASSIVNAHPDASYFSVQIYKNDNLATPIYHWNDIDIMGDVAKVMDLNASYSKTLLVDSAEKYFALFRIYNSFVSSSNDTLSYWAGLPPRTYINGVESPLCDIDYLEKDNIYSNLSNQIDPATGTICSENEVFGFTVIPEGSLANSDANYLIACIKPNTGYKIRVKMPQIMCSVGYASDEPGPWINESYALRYASMSVESTMAPRPTVASHAIPCDTREYDLDIFVEDAVPYPGLLYRQLLPNPEFMYSIANAKQKCYKHADKGYDTKCIKKQMGDYYPSIVITSDKSSVPS
jgi:hypothetical protein